VITPPAATTIMRTTQAGARPSLEDHHPKSAAKDNRRTQSPSPWLVTRELFALMGALLATNAEIISRTCWGG
jgi:hypothetical protein